MVIRFSYSIIPGVRLKAYNYLGYSISFLLVFSNLINVPYAIKKQHLFLR